MEQSVEEIVRTSDERAVRMAFDERNLGWFRVILMVSFAVASILLIAGLARRHWIRALDPAANATIDAVLLLALADKRKDARLARFVRAHLPGVIIATMALQSVFGLLLTPRRADPSIPWVAMFPWFMTGFRMATVELTLLHGSLAAISLVNALLLPTDTGPMIGAAVSMNLLALGINVIASRRRRREILGVWQERRRHAGEVVRMRDELQYAREIQLSMLPEAPPPLNWVDVAGISIPATEVGGDYYDYFVVGDRLAIVSGDVAGHGLASGIVLATLRSGFTLLRHSLTDPADVLRQLHDLVAETSRRRTLVTCAVLLLDREKRRATIASAGHPPVIVRRGGRAETLELFAPPLGVKLEFDVPRRELAFEPGDVFVLHTDGVYESTNANGESYGLDRLASIVAESGLSGARELRDLIVNDVERFRGGDKQRDDVTIVVATIGAC
jgi:stage II sporulation SpoE-like protein